jgi:hypothetical protein
VTQFVLKSLITDLPLQTIASLNNYVIRNIIYQETADLDEPSLADQPQFVITRNSNMYAMGADPQRLLAEKKSCQQCLGKSKSYIDQLKYDLFKRIELEVNRGRSARLLSCFE